MCYGDRSVVSRRRFLALAGAGSVAACGGLILTPRAAEAAWPALRRGDVFLTRNLFNNIVPGYWNHVALYDAGFVYEAQPSPGIRSVPYAAFLKENFRIRVLRLNGQYLVPRMLDYAKSLVGEPYNILPITGKYTCVMYIRASYYFATLATTPVDPGWLTPDHLARDTRFVDVGGK